MNTYLSDHEKRQLLESNLRSFALDSYGHELNRQVAVSNGDNDAVTLAEQAIETIAIATATYQAELQTLPSSDVLEIVSEPTV